MVEIHDDDDEALAPRPTTYYDYYKCLNNKSLALTLFLWIGYMPGWIINNDDTSIQPGRVVFRVNPILISELMRLISKIMGTFFY